MPLFLLQLSKWTTLPAAAAPQNTPTGLGLNTGEPGERVVLESVEDLEGGNGSTLVDVAVTVAGEGGINRPGHKEGALKSHVAVGGAARAVLRVAGDSPAAFMNMNHSGCSYCFTRD